MNYLKISISPLLTMSASVVVAMIAPIDAKAADVVLKRENQEIHITAQVQEDFAGTEATVYAPDTGTVEVRVPGADLMVDGKRQLFRFEDEAVRNVSVSRDGSTGVVRFNLKGLNGSAVSEQLTVNRGSGRIRIAIPIELAPSATTASTSVRTATISESPDLVAKDVSSAPAMTTPDAEAAVVSTEAKQVAPAASEASAQQPKSQVRDNRPESEIPVFAASAGEKKQASSGIERLVLTLFVLCVVLGAAIFGLKKWSVRRKANGSNPTKIQVLTQHYLGPKKSIAIIQVAGEAILIGVTDHNISMLKTLALIDDEVPGVVPKNFADQLDQEGFAGEDEVRENFAMKGLSEVRDIVSARFPVGRGSGKTV